MAATLTDRPTGHLAEATRRERVASYPGPSPYVLEGVALAREAASAVRPLARSAGLSEAERDALAQLVTERVLRNRRRRGSAREVIAYMDRAERMPLTCARESLRVERGRIGRNLLTAIARDFMRDSREWRDVASTYKRRERAQQSTGAMVESAEAIAPGLLAEAIARNHAASGTPVLAPLAEDARELASAALDLERERQSDGTAKVRASEAVLANMQAAMERALGGELATLAAERAVTLTAIEQRCKRGYAAWVALYPKPADLVALVREAAERAGLTERPPTDRPTLTPAALAAMYAIERLAPTDCYRSPGHPDRPDRPAPLFLADSRTDAPRAVLEWIDSLSVLCAERGQLPSRAPASGPVRRTVRVAVPHSLASVGYPASAPVEAERALEAAMRVWSYSVRHECRLAAPTAARGVLTYMDRLTDGTD